MQKKTITNIIAVIGFILTGVFVSLNHSSSVSAYSLTVSTSGSVTANVMPSADGGIGTTVVTDNVNIISNCRAGYTMTIAGPTDNNLYLNGDSTNNTSGTYFSPVNGTSALNNSANANKWGYSLTANSGTGVFKALTSTPTTLKTPSQTASPDSDIDTTIPVYYGTAVNTSMAPGSYTFSNNTSIAYTVVMDATCLTVNIAYDGNNADEGTMGAVGTGVIHTGVKDGDTVSLVASNFSRTGYGFAGWSTDPNAGAKLLDNDNTNNPIVYGPQEDVTLPAGFTDLDTDNDGIVKLYAVWLQSQGNLQGWMGCNNLDTSTYDSNTGALDLTKNSVTALTDQRDNDTYAVARLADGKCWMIENLRLDNDAAHNSDGLLAQGYGTSATYGNFGGLADPETPDKFGASSVANSMYSTNGNNGTINIGTSNAGSRFPRYNNKNTQNRALNPTENNSALYSYGNYYTWHAAIADLTPNNTDNNSTTSTSICPAGWHLPTGGKGYPAGNTSGVNVTGELSTYRDFYNLGYKIMGLSAYESNPNSGTSFYDTTTKNIAGDTANEAFRRYPNNYTYSGAVWNGGYGNYGFRGDYWTSTAHSSSTSSYIFTLYSSENVFPGTGGSSSKHYGQTIRCINSDSQTYTLTYDANGGSSAPGSQSTTANGLATFTITNTVPTRSGYTFAGWMDEKGNEAQPGSSFTTKNPNTTLYAIWTNNSCNPTATTIGTGNASTDAVCLQDVKPGMKASLSIADATTGTYNLIDARDGQSYTVAKLADGELWLTKNLNYGNNTDVLLTPYDTDLPTGITFKAPASTTDFETTNSDATYVSPKILTDNTYGSYYSYAAAIASTTAYSTSQNITTSICPKGWDLPTSTQYNNLRTVSGNTTYAKMSAAPYSFIYAGYRNGTSFTSQTSAIRLWTSTNYSASYAYYTTAYSTASYSSNYKRYGESVRCIANNGTVTVNYDGNGTTEYPVTGTTASQTNVEINSTNAMTNGFIRDGWAFDSWNTSADGSGTSIAAGASLNNLNLQPNGAITLYAQWVPQYTITYVHNCKTWAPNDANCTDAKSTSTSTQKINLNSSGNGSATLKAYNTWTNLSGWKIKEWTTNADGTGTAYLTSSTYTITGANPGDEITLYAHWTPIYTVQYEGNGSDNDSTGMGSTDATTGIKSVAHTNVSEGDTFDLFASNFKKAGYGFVGWSTDSNAWSKLTDNDNTNDAKIWGPNETFTAPAFNASPIVTLYAVWAPAETNGGNPVYLQSWTGCSSMTATTYDSSTGTLAVSRNSVTALTDIRDGQVYAVAKLVDGACWMIENLRLADTHEENGNTVATVLSTSNTNIKSNNSTLPITNIYSSSTKSNSLSPSSNEQFDATSAPYGWCREYSAACLNQSRLNTDNTTADITPSLTQNMITSRPYAHTNFNIKAYSYGNYYNWYSATAGYGTYSWNTGEPTEGDLCPTGWRLPYGGLGSYQNIKGSFYYFAEQMDVAGNYRSHVTSNKFRSFPNNYVFSSTVSDNGIVYNLGNYSEYYSALAQSNNNSVFFFSLKPDEAFPANVSSGYNEKGYGFPIRCVTGL
ncbi:MAG: FISUMP domain-containing protein [Candidatus Saccharibacteria bacterium]|nr:FISUMP domain-containing protein [Candidatus Saccharibacteria bacterium]